MSCDHRFINYLIPKEKDLHFLFIGTFNPEWDSDNSNNAEYFYGRGTNLFWCIMPHAFGEHCLIDKSVSEWKAFCNCTDRKIGITDLIIRIPNADMKNEQHRKLLMSYQDENIDLKVNKENIFSLDFHTTSIMQMIHDNSSTLKGIFFTRSTSQKISRIWDEWKKIEKFSKQLNKERSLSIKVEALLSPSSKAKGSIKEKIQNWKAAIEGSVN